MNYLRRKVTTAKNKYNVADFSAVKGSFLRSVVETVTMEEIPPELILNWDQTGIMIISSSSSIMHERGVKRVELTGLKDIKVADHSHFCGSIQGDFSLFS